MQSEIRRTDLGKSISPRIAAGHVRQIVVAPLPPENESAINDDDDLEDVAIANPWTIAKINTVGKRKRIEAPMSPVELGPSQVERDFHDITRGALRTTSVVSRRWPPTPEASSPSGRQHPPPRSPVPCRNEVPKRDMPRQIGQERLTLTPRDTVITSDSIDQPSQLSMIPVQPGLGMTLSQIPDVSQVRAHKRRRGPQNFVNKPFKTPAPGVSRRSTVRTVRDAEQSMLHEGLAENQSQDRPREALRDNVFANQMSAAQNPVGLRTNSAQSVHQPRQALSRSSSIYVLQQNATDSMQAQIRPQQTPHTPGNIYLQQQTPNSAISSAQQCPDTTDRVDNIYSQQDSRRCDRPSQVATSKDGKLSSQYPASKFGQTERRSQNASSRIGNVYLQQSPATSIAVAAVSNMGYNDFQSQVNSYSHALGDGSNRESHGMTMQSSLKANIGLQPSEQSTMSRYFSQARAITIVSDHDQSHAVACAARNAADQSTAQILVPSSTLACDVTLAQIAQSQQTLSTAERALTESLQHDTEIEADQHIQAMVPQERIPHIIARLRTLLQSFIEKRPLHTLTGGKEGELYMDVIERSLTACGGEKSLFPIAGH